MGKELRSLDLNLEPRDIATNKVTAERMTAYRIKTQKGLLSRNLGRSDRLTKESFGLRKDCLPDIGISSNDLRVESQDIRLGAKYGSDSVV